MDFIFIPKFRVRHCWMVKGESNHLICSIVVCSPSDCALWLWSLSVWPPTILLLFLYSMHYRLRSIKGVRFRFANFASHFKGKCHFHFLIHWVLLKSLPVLSDCDLCLTKQPPSLPNPPTLLPVLNDGWIFRLVSKSYLWFGFRWFHLTWTNREKVTLSRYKVTFKVCSMQCLVICF